MKKMILALTGALTLTALIGTAAAFAGDAAEADGDKPISRFPVPTYEELPDDLQQLFTKVEESRGFVPNVLYALAHRPDELRAFLAYNEAVTGKQSGLSKADKEMLIVAFSSANGCTYCVMSHGAALRIASENPFLAEQVATNYREADITERQKAMIEFGLKMTNDSTAVGEGDFEILRSHGFSEEDIWDIGAITAFYNLSNRMMSLLAVHADEEFYMMGRR